MGGLRAPSNLTTPDFDHDESPFPGLVRWRYWLAKRPPQAQAPAPSQLAGGGGKRHASSWPRTLAWASVPE
jgi:hypothetical protein